jgi:RHS repeat-associated protein
MAMNKTKRSYRHPGSASLTTDVSGQKVAELRYLPFGETRWMSGTTPTDRRYTGQREVPAIGLYDYNARMYWPAAGRFVSADTIVPRLKDPQAFNRYAYARNSPLVRVDPTGHIDCAQYFGLMDCVMAHYAEMALIAAAVAMVPVVVKAG